MINDISEFTINWRQQIYDKLYEISNQVNIMNTNQLHLIKEMERLRHEQKNDHEELVKFIVIKSAAIILIPLIPIIFVVGFYAYYIKSHLGL